MKMTNWFIGINFKYAPSLLLSLALGMYPELVFSKTPSSRYMATVQFVVHERTPELLIRSQQVGIDHFENIFRSSPDFRNGKYDVQTKGHEVVFSMTTEHDPRHPLQAMLMEWTRKIHGRVDARGKSSVYRVNLSEGDSDPMVYVDAPINADGKVKIAYVLARQARLGDILAALKTKVRSFSYFLRMPMECADSFVIDYDFGDPSGDKVSDLSVVLDHLKLAFDIDEEITSDGLHAFKVRNCPQRRVRQTRLVESDLLRNAVFIGKQGERTPFVSFQLPPLE